MTIITRVGIRFRSALRSLRDRENRADGSWLEAERVLACRYPRREDALLWLSRQGISVLVNLHERPHNPLSIAQHNLTEVHLPVRDFTPPSPEQIDRGVEAIAAALAEGKKVAVHCGAGLGRTGTLLACYLVNNGLSPDEAINRVREARPGSIETRSQVEAVRAYAERHLAKNEKGSS
jgi:atypical dual specificity phosphatase